MITITERVAALNFALSAADPSESIWRKMLSDEIARITLPPSPVQAGQQLQDLSAVELWTFLGGNHAPNAAAFAADLVTLHAKVAATLAP